MIQYILINRIKVQNANAIAGFTWGFPAITHFLGFAHNISRKINTSVFSDIKLGGCAVIAHEHHVHTYGNYGDSFTQNRNPPYLPSHDKSSAPPVIEEGKMNMTVSLLIGFDGNIGNRVNDFIAWLTKTSLMQRLAGGTVLDIQDIKIVTTETSADCQAIKRNLLPGFILMDRSHYLADYYNKLKAENSNAELLDAWLDFSALKYQARPHVNLIDSHLKEMSKINAEFVKSYDDWLAHKNTVPYCQSDVPNSIKQYFSVMEPTKTNSSLLNQWQEYLDPTEKTDADWELLPKPIAKGYLIPIMTGYKAISPVYENADIANTRDSETPVCFVEAVHSIGEWRGVNRFRTESDFQSSLWHYHYEDHWYLCKQKNKDVGIQEDNDLTVITNTNDIFGE